MSNGHSMDIVHSTHVLSLYYIDCLHYVHSTHVLSVLQSSKEIIEDKHS